MANDEGTQAAAGKRSAATTAGVTVTAVVLFAAAIVAGTRHAKDAGPLGGPPLAAPAQEAVPAAPPAAAAPPVAGPSLPPRHLQPANRQELESTLPKGARIDVTAMAGDPEAQRLAHEIRAFLLAKGYQVGDVTRSISTPPAKGVGLQPLADGKWRVIVGNAEQ
ncbi:MAG TPA: hypothetical protein VGP64_13045 [Polyangia bacterium]|jgi:hypothetical protein